MEGAGHNERSRTQCRGHNMQWRGQNTQWRGRTHNGGGRTQWRGQDSKLWGIIESVDSISRDERDVPLTQYITNA